MRCAKQEKRLFPQESASKEVSPKGLHDIFVTKLLLTSQLSMHASVMERMPYIVRGLLHALMQHRYEGLSVPQFVQMSSDGVICVHCTLSKEASEIWQ